MGRTAEAVACLRRALEIAGFSRARSNLAIALTDQGLVDEAIEHHRRAVAQRPDIADLHNNLAMALVCAAKLKERSKNIGKPSRFVPILPTCTATCCLRSAISTSSRRRCSMSIWRGRTACAACARRRTPNLRDPDRKLRIGYVSSDFKDHAAAHFIKPVLEAHDRESLEVFCYSNSLYVDGVTKHLQSCADPCA